MPLMALTFPLHRNPAPATDDDVARVLADPGFGDHFTDHMAVANWDRQTGWHNDRIVDYAPVAMDPAGADYHFPDLHLTPGFILGVQQPASFRSPELGLGGNNPPASLAGNEGPGARATTEAGGAAAVLVAAFAAVLPAGFEGSAFSVSTASWRSKSSARSAQPARRTPESVTSRARRPRNCAT